MRILPLAISTLGFASASDLYNSDLPTVLQPHHFGEDLPTRQANAKKALHAIRTLSSSIQAGEAVKGTADAVGGALDLLEEVNPVFAVLGVFLSFLEIFFGSDSQMILDELKKIEEQIERLRGDMQYFFSKVIDEQRQAACFAQMAPYENKIRAAWSALTEMNKNHGAENYQTYVNVFKDECANAQCSDAAHGILNTITGQGSFVQCDMMTILYEGNPEGRFFKGVRDEVVSKAGYLQSLVAMAITAESAYQSLRNNDKDAWKAVNA